VNAEGIKMRLQKYVCKNIYDFSFIIMIQYSSRKYDMNAFLFKRFFIEQIKIYHKYLSKSYQILFYLIECIFECISHINLYVNVIEII